MSAETTETIAQPDTWLGLDGIARELGLSSRATIEVVNSYITSGFPEGHVLPPFRVRWKRSEVIAWRDAPREPEWQFGDAWPGPEVPARDAEPHEIPTSCARLVKVAEYNGGWLTRVTYARGTVPTAQGRPGKVIATVALRFRRPPRPGMHQQPARGYALWREGAGRWTYEGGAVIGLPPGIRYHKLDKDNVERLELVTQPGVIHKLSSVALKLVLAN